MVRSKQLSRKEAARSLSTIPPISGGSALENSLLEFMDRFDIYLFLYDAGYRRRLKALLDGFTDDEFEIFTRTHSHRFTVN